MVKFLVQSYKKLQKKYSRLIANYNNDIEQAFLKLSKTNNEELEYIIVDDEAYMRKTA